MMESEHEPDPVTGEAVGKLVDVKAAERPGPMVLAGRFGRVERLDPARHGEDLWNGVKDAPTLWAYMGYGPFANRAAFDAWLARHAATEDPYAYAVTAGESGAAVGISTLMEIRPLMRVIETGNILYAPALQRTPLATEAQYLLARYAFDTLRYRRYEWKCNALNAPSRRAAARFGFTYEGTFRQHMIVKGRNRDTAWFAMLDGDWPRLKAGYQRWLDPANFDAAGAQRTRLRF
jgi:RimJ/RimL family protein N-acetyltransferase